MAFKVRFTEDRDRMSDYDTGDAYDFLEGGVLSSTRLQQGKVDRVPRAWYVGAGCGRAKTLARPNRALSRWRRTRPGAAVFDFTK
jgi:hypothetical protein